MSSNIAPNLPPALPPDLPPSLKDSKAFADLRGSAAAWQAAGFPALRGAAPAIAPLRLLGIGVDLTRQRINAEMLAKLLAFGEERALAKQCRRLFDGEIVNHSENKAALHWQPRTQPRAERADLELAEAIRSQRWRLPSGEAVSNVLHLGIGGSDVGPRLLVHALKPEGKQKKTTPVTFLASLDARQRHAALEGLDPRRTLVILASKGFATEETSENWQQVKAWLGAKNENAALAITAQPEAALAQGFAKERILDFSLSIGGRFSIWSCVSGLPTAIAHGAENFRQLLMGAKAVDDHVRSAPLSQNIPALRALLSFWELACLGSSSTICLSYDHRLSLFPEWRQQVSMESNGKGVDIHGQALPSGGSPLILTGSGTEAQHAFMQALHQGQTIAPVEFTCAADAATLNNIAADADKSEADNGSSEDSQQRQLAHVFAQADALWQGRDAQTLRKQGCPESLLPHRHMPGLRPSVITLCQQLDAFTLGALLALHEHQTLYEGWLFGLNSFDQWGVELGKILANPWRQRIKEARLSEDYPFSLLGQWQD